MCLAGTDTRDCLLRMQFEVLNEGASLVQLANPNAVAALNNDVARMDTYVALVGLDLEGSVRLYTIPRKVSYNRARAASLWASERPLRAWLGREELFPYRIPVGKPDAREWLTNFADLRAALGELEGASKSSRGVGYTVETAEATHQKLGRIRVPLRVSFENVEDLAECAGETQSLQRFRRIAGTLLQQEPRLSDWLARHPLAVLEFEPELPRLLAVARYLEEHPRPKRYARELGISGVDSKFIERYKPVLSQWLDLLLPADAINTEERGIASGGFERRFGLLYEEPSIRFRWLDRKMALKRGITDAAVPLEQFASWRPDCSLVIVTENKVTFLTLPEKEKTLAIFGAGYSIDRLGAVPWVSDVPIYYWGDIDTHGFSILSRLRRSLPKTVSFLMDRATLLAHKEVWSEEPSDCRYLAELEGLSADEHAFYDDLRNDRLGMCVRLEQERVMFERVLEAVKRL